MTLSLHFFNVGQGDCLGGILPSGGGAFLVDVKDAAVIVKYFQSRENFKFIVITHGDLDHLEGLYDLIANYHFHVGCIYINSDRGPGASNPERYRTIMRNLDVWVKDGVAKAEPIYVSTSIDDSGLLEVIHPTYSYLLRMTSLNKRNNSSVVIQVRYKGKIILLCGDIEAEGITELIVNNRGKLKCNVLKVPHHGAYQRSRAFEKLIDETKPEYAVISVGVGNPKGHPHWSTLECLRSDGVRVFQTQEDSDKDAVSILATIGVGGLTVGKYRSINPVT